MGTYVIVLLTTISIGMNGLGKEVHVYQEPSVAACHTLRDNWTIAIEYTNSVNAPMLALVHTAKCETYIVGRKSNG